MLLKDRRVDIAHCIQHSLLGTASLQPIEHLIGARVAE
jgi:hypothetical protein